MKSVQSLESELEQLRAVLKDRDEEVKVQKVQIKCLKDSLLEKQEMEIPAVEVVKKKTGKKTTGSSTHALKKLESERDSFMRENEELKNTIEEYKRKEEEDSFLNPKSNDSHFDTEKEIQMFQTELALERKRVAEKDELIASLQIQVENLQRDLTEQKQKSAKEMAAFSTILSSDKKRLETEVESLRASLNNGDNKTPKEMAILRKDRETLTDQVRDQALTIQSLRDQISQLERQVLVSKSTAIVQKDPAAAVKVSSCMGIPINSRSVTEKEGDAAFQKKYSLPETEFCIVYFSCTYNHKPGVLQITPQYLIYDTILNIIGDNKIIISLRDIVSLNKVKVKGWMPGKGADVEVLLSNGTVHLFSNFMKRKQALLDISHQASNVGRTVNLLRDGKPDTNSSLHE